MEVCHDRLSLCLFRMLSGSRYIVHTERLDFNPMMNVHIYLLLKCKFKSIYVVSNLIFTSRK